MKLAPFIIVATAALLPRYVDAQAAPRDPYSCYRAKTGDSGIRFTAKFTDPLRSGIHLDDAFGETTFGVRKLEWACTAAAVGQGSVADPDSGFLGYRLRRIRKRCAPGAFNELASCTRDENCAGAPCVPAPPFDRTNASNRAVHLVDAFGTARMDLLRPDILLVPASHAPANAGAPLPDPGAAPAEQRELDSYTCYRANPTRKVCASDAPFNPNGYCARDSDCATPPDFADLVSDACRPAPRHDRSTSVYTADSVAGARTYRLPRTSHVCSAADKDGEGMVDDRARMSCYVARETRRCRAGTNNEFAACRRDVDCGPAQSPGSCVRDAKFDQKDPDHRNLFFNDGLDFLASANVSIDHHRLDLVRPAIFCTPACELPPREVALSPFVVQAASVGISSTQEATRGLDVDGDPATCAPLIPGVCDPAANASDGVDNALTGLAGALNQALGAALAQRGLVLLFELDSFVDGPVDVRAVLVAPDPNDASCDIQNPNSPCTFIASASSLTADLDDGCRGVVRTAVPVTLTGTGYPGEAKVTGQAVGSEIEIVLPIGVDGVVLKLRDVIVDAVLAHDTQLISAVGGILGGE